LTTISIAEHTHAIFMKVLVLVAVAVQAQW
jgi:hypothetical protein